MLDAGGKETLPARFNANTKLGHEVANVVSRTVPVIPINMDF